MLYDLYSAVFSDIKVLPLNCFDNIMQVSADVLSSLMDKSDIITLDICTALLPLLTSLLESKMDRYASISSLRGGSIAKSAKELNLAFQNML
ncbi:hypothetical protein GW17_00004132 [Ensete ventricosum]|nr:hypothetical protein GW17_00004132 [Ensete ventricosum]